jgi:tetratricopeptide (TPR) repeat protein
MLRKLLFHRPLSATILRRFSGVAASDSPSRFMELYTKATDEFRLGNLEKSIEFNREALKEADLNTSISWRDVAAVQLNQSHMLKLIYELVEARSLALLALGKLDAHFSSNKHEVCHALDVVAELCCELEDLKEGMKFIDRALEIKSRVDGPSGLSLARSYNIRGALLLKDDKIEEARSDYLRALGINIRNHGRERPLPLAVGITLSNIGGVLRKEKDRVSECVALYREVADCFEANVSNPEKSWMLGSALTDLAESLMDVKSKAARDEAKSHLARSLHIFISTRGMDHPSTARAAGLLRLTGQSTTEEETSPSIENSTEFVDNLLNECERIVPRKEGKVSGDIIFLDRRGHIGHGHPHSPLI